MACDETESIAIGILPNDDEVKPIVNCFHLDDQSIQNNLYSMLRYRGFDQKMLFTVPLSVTKIYDSFWAKFGKEHQKIENGDKCRSFNARAI